MAKKGYFDAIDGKPFILEPECKISCCDCGLVHKYKIRLLVEMVRDERSTGQVRRWRKKNKQEE